MSMDGYLEDHSGFFCGRCGRTKCVGTPCTPPLTSSDVHWDVVVQTMIDSLAVSWEPFLYNGDTRRRALEGLRTFLADRWRLDRIQSARRYR